MEFGDVLKERQLILQVILLFHSTVIGGTNLVNGFVADLFVFFFGEFEVLLGLFHRENKFPSVVKRLSNIELLALALIKTISRNKPAVGVGVLYGSSDFALIETDDRLNGRKKRPARFGQLGARHLNLFLRREGRQVVSQRDPHRFA